MLFCLILLGLIKTKQIKKNESFDFKWDQKVLSMLIFVFLVSMVPTVVMYYIWFLMIALFIFGVKVRIINYKNNLFFNYLY